MRRWGTFAVLICASFALSSPVRAGGYAPAEVAFTLQDARIGESSGVATALTDDRVMFTHNDSGDAPRFFAVGPDGATLRTFNVTGAQAIDWEDMAAGPSSVPTTSGRSLYFGDFGNNNRDRSVIVIYEVAEPVVAVEGAGPAVEVDVPVISTRTLSWSTVPHDCETLLVDPTGRIYVVAKIASGQSGVFEAQGPNLVQVGELSFASYLQLDSRLDYPARWVRGGLQATGGDISDDGRKLVVRTYSDAYEWTIAGDLPTAIKSPPLRIVTPNTAQAEAITYSNTGTLLITTEGVRSQVHRIRALS